MSAREINVGLLVTRPDLIPLSHLLSTGYINKGIVEVAAVFDGRKRSARNLAKIVALAFKRNIKLRDVYVDDSRIEERDQCFALQFGFTIAQLAYARLSGGQIEAWIGPTLIPKSYPLAQTESQNTVMVTSRSLRSSTREDQSEVRPYKEIILAHYVRMTVKDHPGVLASITKEFAERNINIKGVIQPKAQEGSGETDVAFILRPCQTGVLQSALASIGASEDILRTHAVFRVLL